MNEEYVLIFFYKRDNMVVGDTGGNLWIEVNVVGSIKILIYKYVK